MEYKGTEKLEASYRRLPKNTLDVLFLGPSTSMNGILPLDLWSKYGIASYNASCGSQTMGEAYYIIQDVLKRQQPKLIVLECSSVKDTATIVSNAHFHYVSDVFSFFDPLKTRMVNDLVRTENQGWSGNFRFLFPIYEYHGKWSRITEECFAGSSRAMQFGAKLPVRHWRIQEEDIITVAADEKADMPDVSSEFINKIVLLCRDKGIELLLYVTPTFRSEEKTENASELYKMYNSLDAYNLQEEVSFVNLNYLRDEVGLDLNEDYSDTVHLNTLGAEKLTDWIGNYIGDRYEIQDHRGENRYKYYNQAYASYASIKKVKRLQTIRSSKEYLNELRHFRSNYVIAIAVKDIIGFYLSEDMLNDLMELGIHSDLINHRGWYSYIAVINDGFVIIDALNSEESLTGMVEVSLNDHMFSIVSSPLHADNMASIMIDGTEYAVNKRGLNVVVFDKEKGEVIDSVDLDIHSKSLNFYRR